MAVKAAASPSQAQDTESVHDFKSIRLLFFEYSTGFDYFEASLSVDLKE